MASDRDTLRMFWLPLPSLTPDLLLGQVEFVAGVTADLQDAAVGVGGLARIPTWGSYYKKSQLKRHDALG